MFGYRGIGYRKWLLGFSITERSVIEVLLYIAFAILTQYQYWECFKDYNVGTFAGIHVDLFTKCCLVYY